MQLAGQYDAAGGVRLSLSVPLGDAATLGRQVLKSDTCTVRCDRRLVAAAHACCVLADCVARTARACPSRSPPTPRSPPLPPSRPASIPELEFEIGAASYAPFAGELTSVGQVLMTACKNLNLNQAERRTADAEQAGKIDEFIQVGGVGGGDTVKMRARDGCSPARPAWSSSTRLPPPAPTNAAGAGAVCRGGARLHVCAGGRGGQLLHCGARRRPRQ